MLDAIDYMPVPYKDYKHRATEIKGYCVRKWSYMGTLENKMYRLDSSV